MSKLRQQLLLSDHLFSANGRSVTKDCEIYRSSQSRVMLLFVGFPWHASGNAKVSFLPYKEGVTGSSPVSPTIPYAVVVVLDQRPESFFSIADDFCDDLSGRYHELDERGALACIVFHPLPGAHTVWGGGGARSRNSGRPGRPKS